jgi:hypothetical protein
MSVVFLIVESLPDPVEPCFCKFLFSSKKAIISLHKVSFSIFQDPIKCGNLVSFKYSNVFLFFFVLLS